MNWLIADNLVINPNEIACAAIDDSGPNAGRLSITFSGNNVPVLINNPEASRKILDAIQTAAKAEWK